MVGDASMWVSLAATGEAAAYIRAFGFRAVITEPAFDELARGRAKGRMAADEVVALIYMNLVEQVRLEPEDEPLFLGLLSGPASETLDDGEAATLTWAARTGALAIIDEKKATLVAVRHAPEVAIQSTVDLMLASGVVATLGRARVATGIYAALTNALMRVPPHRLDDVVGLIGVERARHCRSLPAALRNRAPGLDLDTGPRFGGGEVV